MRYLYRVTHWGQSWPAIYTELRESAPEWGVTVELLGTFAGSAGAWAVLEELMAADPPVFRLPPGEVGRRCTSERRAVAGLPPR